METTRDINPTSYNTIVLTIKFEDIKGVIRRRNSQKDRQHNDQQIGDAKGLIWRHKSKDRQQNCEKFEDITGLIRRCNTKKDRQCNGRKFADIKGLIRRRTLKKDRQCNDQKKTDQRTSNDLQTNTQKTKDWVTRTPTKIESEFRCSGRVCSSYSTSGTRHHTHLHLCHTNSAMVTQVVARPLNVRNDDSNLTIRTPCVSRFIGRSNRLWRKSL